VIKRLIDVLVSVVGLILLLPVAAIVAVLVKLDSRGPVLFRQERIGRAFHPFVIYKFRTMAAARTDASHFTPGDESRVTRVGGMLRRTKLDELPQLFNVLVGDMSLVGPRPEVRQFVEMFREDYSEILQARPGLTDLASIKYRNEAAMLAAADDPEAEYVARILPDKIRLAREYVRRSSVAFDLALLAKTVWRVAGGKVTA
jgi:lipopolysaccharide/colanic/teichoic acid biosynthesis glycosyltransferase